MKRNEEYDADEVLVCKPFFFDKCAPNNLFRLIKYLGFKSVRGANGREDFLM